MQNNIGSVYLDTPARPSRKAEAQKTHGSRAKLSSFALFVGLTALTMAIMIGGLRAIVLDPAPLLSAYETTIDDPLARAELEREIATGIHERLVGPELTIVANAFELDVVAEAERISLVVLDDATVREELRLLVEDIHRRVVVEPGTSDIDLAPITAAILSVIEAESPRLATIIPTDATLWSTESDVLPDLTAQAGLLDQALLAALGLTLLIPLAFAIHPRRHRMAAYAGRWILTVGLLCGLAAIGLPYLAGNLSGWSTVEIAVRALSLKLLAPAGIAGIVGTGLVSSAAVLKHRENRRTADEGAAAALGGLDEPAMLGPSASRTLDLPSRGLVDVNHPLTNI